MATFTDFINSLSPVLSKDAKPVNGLSIASDATVNIGGNVMTVHTSTQDFTYALTGYTLSSLSSALTANGIGNTVLYSTPSASALTLMDVSAGVAMTSVPLTLQVFTSPNYVLFRAAAAVLDQAAQSSKGIATQYNLRSAQAAWLDYWGWFLQVPRYQGEPDNLYAERIFGLKFGHNVNNIALQNFFLRMGYQTTIADTSPGAFSVNVNLPTQPPQGYTYSTSQLQDALTTLKAVGTIATVLLQGTASDSIALTDSVASTVSDPATYVWAGLTTSILGISYLMPAGWVWGTGQWMT